MTHTNRPDRAGDQKQIQLRWSGLAMAALLIFGIPASLYAVDVAQDRRYVVQVVKATPLLTLPLHQYPRENPLGSLVIPGQRLQVLRVRYGKDFQAMRVETEGGEVGWVLNGNGVEVVSRGRE